MKSVFIGIPDYAMSVNTRTMHALMATSMQLPVAHELKVRSGNSLIHIARCRLAHDFLASDFERLFMIDSDIVWRVEDFVRMLELSEHMDVLVAAYRHKTDERHSFSMRIDEDAQPNAHGCYPIEGAGLGFTVVSRRVMQTLAERAPLAIFTGYDPVPKPYLFRCDLDYDHPVTIDGHAYPQTRGEDMAFFHDVRDAGFGVFLYPEAQLGHVGQKVYEATPIMRAKP